MSRMSLYLGRPLGPGFSNLTPETSPSPRNHNPAWSCLGYHITHLSPITLTLDTCLGDVQHVLVLVPPPWPGLFRSSRGVLVHPVHNPET